MLVLTRKVREEIVIGDSVVINVIGIRGDSVRIGISAPREMNIRRQEIPPKREAENDATSR